MVKTAYKQKIPNKAFKKKFPRYFLLGSDTLITVDFDPKTNEVFAINKFGDPYPPLKALVTGQEVNKVLHR